MSEKDIAKQIIIDVPRSKRTKIIKESFHLLFYLILVFFTSYMITQFIGQRTQVIGKSMENTLTDQDNLIVDKISYHFIHPKRFDIIVFSTDNSTDKYYIKRIIGMPGETVQIIDSEIYINDQLLDENYGKEKIDVANTGLAERPILIGEDEYFVLGDNRNHSSDSRDKDIGKVCKTSIVGKAWIRVWPINRLRILKHQ